MVTWSWMSCSLASREHYAGCSLATLECALCCVTMILGSGCLAGSLSIGAERESGSSTL